MKGQTFIEVLFVLNVITVVATAVVVVVATSVLNMQFIKNQSQATQYSQEGIETVRQIRNSDYEGFKKISGVYCMGRGKTKLGSPQGSCPVANADNFIRKVEIEQSPGCALDVALITVTTTWADGKCGKENKFCHKSELISCLSTINPVKAP